MVYHLCDIKGVDCYCGVRVAHDLDGCGNVRDGRFTPKSIQQSKFLHMINLQITQQLLALFQCLLYPVFHMQTLYCRASLQHIHFFVQFCSQHAILLMSSLYSSTNCSSIPKITSFQNFFPLKT